MLCFQVGVVFAGVQLVVWVRVGVCPAEASTPGFGWWWRRGRDLGAAVRQVVRVWLEVVRLKPRLRVLAGGERAGR